MMVEITMVGGVMDNGFAARSMIDKMLPERLERLRSATGLPVVFGGVTRQGPEGEQLVLEHLTGTVGDKLQGLVVPQGRGLGGSVLRERTPQRVSDYATTMAITHEYDQAVVQAERLTSVIAIPVVVSGEVQGVMYGAVRDRRPIGDRTVQAAIGAANQLRSDIEDKLGQRPGETGYEVRSAVAELGAVIRDTRDPELRERLIRIRQSLIAGSGRVEAKPVLTPREIETLRLVAVGSSNSEIATRLGLSLETVKAYLRSAMRRLEVRNPAAAAHQARLHGLL
jgi:DNA-binding CsgD family transcriptional regulator